MDKNSKRGSRAATGVGIEARPEGMSWNESTQFKRVHNHEGDQRFHFSDDRLPLVLLVVLVPVTRVREALQAYTYYPCGGFRISVRFFVPQR